MQYMGGKARIARRVVEAIMADTPARARWIEPFVGGANVIEQAAPHFGDVRGYDLHPDLVLLWQHVSSGGALPEAVTREMYAEHRRASPSWLRGFLGFGASFGGKWFGGYGVSPRDGELWRQSARTVSRQGDVFTRYGVQFDQTDYADLRPEPGSVIYCDPPYLGTTAYASGTFDHERFYRTVQRWAAECFVYVSEYQVPDHVEHEVIWQRERRTSLKSTVNEEIRLEKLFKILPEYYPWP